jgi:hypothetical protein
MSKLQIVHSLARLQCTRCGAEANASCNCGEPYKPVEIAKAYSRENPSASVREISAQTGVSHASAQRAKSGVSGDTPTTGRDGKNYPAKAKTKTTDRRGRDLAVSALNQIGMAADYLRATKPGAIAAVIAANFDSDDRQRVRADIATIAAVAAVIASVK